MASSSRKRQKQSNSRKKRSGLRAIVLIAAVLVVAAVGLRYFITQKSTAAPSNPSTATDNQTHARQAEPLLGEWRRPDGGYVIHVRDIEDSGLADVAYFNPNPINVARAMALTNGINTGLFVELQDKGYPGATYELTYDPQRDILVGIYHQPAAGGSFNVFFVRKE